MLSRQTKWTSLACVPAALLAVLVVVGYNRAGQLSNIAGSSGKTAKADPNVVELTFTYGSEKRSWIEDVTKEFNASGKKLPDGRTIRVTAIPPGSGECVDEILAGRRQTRLTSPASALTWRSVTAARKRTRKVSCWARRSTWCASPVVIAMWKPMAEALGYGTKPVGWAEVLELVKSDKGWSSAGKPEWGQFRFGHAHPEHSNSGLITVIAEVYASTKGKTDGLTMDDVKNAAPFMEEIEKGVVHYGESTGFFANTMFTNDLGFLNAAVMCENLVIESYDRAKYPNVAAEVVAIYPKEGTFWSDPRSASCSVPG